MPFRSLSLAVTVEGDGPTVLCLHGGPGLWDYMGGLGSETAGWRRVSYTQRGVLPSTTDGPFTVDQHVSDAVAVLDDLGLSGAVVLGHSWGGFLAAALAVAHPARVRGLLLIDPLGLVGDGGYREFDQQMTARTPVEVRARVCELDDKLTAGDASEEEAVESMRLVWPAYFADPAEAPPFPADLRLSVMAASQTMADAFEVLAAGELPTLAAGFDRPVEVVFGEGSPFPASAALDTAAAFPLGRVTGVPAAGHFPWLEQPGCVGSGLARLASRL